MMAATIRVLYVDDEPSLLDIGKQFLEESGDFNVATAMSAPEGIRLLEQEKFDAIISDYQMPGMDGIQFLVEVRKRFGQIPFILFTGRGREEVVIQALNSGADFYLQKGGEPTSQFAELAHSVNSAISRRKADAALRESEDTFKTLFESAGTAIFTMDHSFFLDCNRKTLEIFRCTRDQIIGHSPAEFSPERQPDGHLSAEKMKVKMDAAFLGEEQFFDWVHTCHDGTLLNVNVTLNRVLVRGTYSLQAIVKDITERKRNEEELLKKNEELAASGEELKSQFDALADSERTTRFLVEQLVMSQEIGHNGSWLYDPVTDTTWGSAEAHHLFGFPPVAGDFPMVDKESCIPERERVHQALVDLIHTGKEYNLEYVIHPVDGSAPRVIHSIARFEKDAQDNPIRVVGVFQDITRRKRAEEEIVKKNEELHVAYEQLTAQEKELRAQYDMLALTEAEWKSTFNAISDWITLITPDGRILRTNNAAESLFGTPTGQVLGLNCFELVHGAECLNDDCPRKRMLVTKKRKTTEIPMREGNGWLQVTVDPILNSAGEVVSAVHIVRDISEHMRSQKAMVQAKKKLNFLNYVTFNDIQNLIFILSGYQHLAKKRETDGAAGNIIGKQEEILQKISQSLKFAQSFQDLGLKPPRWQNANHVFLLAISHLDFLRIHHTVQLDGVEVFADPMLEQAFQILADNTLTHGKAATQVTFKYIQEPDSLTLVFEDDGAGIPEDAKEKIFLPDFQKKKGVGLFLAREILDITGIMIRETGEPGKGARFEMTVPKGAYRLTEVKPQ